MKNQYGFTLIELLVVVLIIGILTAVALPQYTTAVEKSRAAEALTLMSAVAGAAERYRLQKDVWPNSFAKLDLEVPVRNDGKPGGKSFIISMGDDASDSNRFVVVAERDINNAKYVLKTIITENGNGSFSQNRICTEETSFDSGKVDAPGDAQAKKYCDAVTNGAENVDENGNLAGF